MGDPPTSAVNDTNCPGTKEKDSASTSNQNRRTSGAISRVSSSVAVIGGRIPAPFAFPHSLDQGLRHRWMPVERGSYTNLYTRLDATHVGYDSRKISLKMEA